MAKKASEHVKYYRNPNGPVIGTVSRKVIEKDGLYFKDLDGSGELKPYDDWRLSPAERAKAYVKVLTVEEKIAQLFISDWRMGKYPAANHLNPTGAGVELDESGLLDDGELHGKTIFGEQHLPGTTDLIQNWFSRHLILRANPKPEDLADWLNQLHAVAEECGHFVPVQVASNSRNENGEIVYGMNDAAGVFATWPGTLGIAAAVKGDNIGIIDKFADCIRREWDAVGMKKGYMYMADVVTDPRWQRTYGTFGEDPELIAEIFAHLIPGIQGSEEGVTPDGVSMTVKHFPGGGPRENGFDPHYAAGQWNVYATPGSLQKYHVAAFGPAVKYHAASIMPYYSKPSADKSAAQEDYEGNPIPFDPYGFAYNKVFIDGMLRKQMGFDGYINSDTGIVHNMCWGVDMLDKPERIGFAVNQSGVDLISGLFDNELGKEAYERAKNGYYETHPAPEGFDPKDLVLTDEALDRAVVRTLTELFQQGMFENPYRDPANAAKAVANQADWAEANEVHRKSVVLLKNDGVLPLTYEKLEGKKIYAEAFCKRPEAAGAATKALREMLGAFSLTQDPEEADFAILMVSPSSGEYFSATTGYLELDICEDKVVCDVDGQGRPMKKTHKETTLSGAGRIAKIAEAVHGNGGKVISNINITLAWEVGNVERYTDALTVGFDTYPSATLDVIFGRFSPVGKLPLTLPRGDEVLAVDENGVCISPNDVPGYDKDLYMPDSLKDENKKAYAYRDAAGNYYELNFGLSY
ncbi:MAG: glycoside hydrolase family 3 N-terminal domain-containing protein [Eubacteriales bacterium]|nr:glycoside hydrolase family 3 N-terminal domain-containing protein [Eubacteriales bacterium]